MTRKQESPFTLRMLCFIATLLFLPLPCWAQGAADSTALRDQVLALTGGRRAKIVWARIPPGGARVEFVTGYWLKDKATREKLAISIVGFDTDEGVERVIVEAPTGCNTPLITYDGSKVIYTDFSENTCYVVNWDGTGKRVLGTGKYRFATAYWRDPSNGTEWVYYNLHYLQPGGHDGQMAVCDPSAVWNKKGDPCIVRRRLDGTGDYETVWDQSNCWYEFSLSADGTRAGGAFETWPHCQVANLKTGELEKYGIGCVSNFAPDDSGRFFYFVGSHASIEFLDAGKKNLRTIPLDFPKNGMRGNEAWPIRWSSDVRFVTLSGPWLRHTDWAPANVQLGRFNESFTGFEAWVTLTQTPGHLDAEPYLWVAPAAASATTPPHTPQPADGKAPLAGAVEAAATPTVEALVPDIVFAWPHGNWRESPAVAFSPEGKRISDFMMSDQGYAHLGRHYQMVINHGGFRADGAGAYVSQQVNASGGFTVAFMLFRNQHADQQLRQVFALGDEKQKNLVVEQDRDGVRLMYQTRDGKPVFVRGRLPKGDSAHVAFSVSPGEVAVYIDGGKPKTFLVRDAEGNPRPPGNWSADTVVVGDAADSQRPWQGEIESLFITSSGLDAAGVARLADTAKAQVAARKPAPRVRLKGRLTQRTDVIKPEVMTYSRGLALYEYDVLEVVEGEYAQSKVYVYHWVLMDKKILPMAARPTGQVYELLLEPFETHPQLQSECQSNTLEGEDIETDYTLYMDVTP